MQPGNVALILTAHLPYVRHPGRSHAGEDALHRLIAYALVPTLNTLYDLRDQGIKPRLGLAYSPILIEQLADPVVQKHFRFWLEEQQTHLDTALGAYEHANRSERVYLGRFYHEWLAGIDHSFDERFGRNLIAALRQLVEDGIVEPLSGTATQACLSQIRRDGSLRAQLELGALTIAQRLGRRPHGFWPPGLSYGGEANELLLASGINYVILDTNRQTVDYAHHREPHWIVPHRLTALSPARRVMAYLYDEGLDYRGDPLYLAPKHDADGFAWSRNGLAHGGEPYDPYDAYRRAQEHATHFADVLAADFGHKPMSEKPELAVVPLDAALLGAGWFEGAAWLRALLTILAGRTELVLTTPGAFLRGTRPRYTLRPLGEGRTVRLVANDQSLRQGLDQAEQRLTELAQHFPDAQAERERVLQQAARELLLAQSDECPVQKTQETLQRAQRHLSRCTQLCDLVEQPAFSDADLTTLEALEEEDNPFAEINYRMFVTG